MKNALKNNNNTNKNKIRINGMSGRRRRSSDDVVIASDHVKEVQTDAHRDRGERGESDASEKWSVSFNFACSRAIPLTEMFRRVVGGRDRNKPILSKHRATCSRQLFVFSPASSEWARLEYASANARSECFIFR